MTRHEAQLAVVGAGPGGVAAAVAAADRGVATVVIDAAAQPGGQYYRRPAAELRARRPQALQHGWPAWRRLFGRLDAHLASGRVRLLAERQVWNVEPGFTLHVLRGPEQRAESVTARAVVLATGGYERVLPFPGWDLPGVLTAGGAQAMLKGSLVLPPGGAVVVAGTGPLLLPVAAGLAAAGAEVAALVESAVPRAFLPHAAALAGDPAKPAQGAGYAARLLRHRVPVLLGHTLLAAHGTDRLEAVTVAGPDGWARRIPCGTLAVSHGMLPHTDLARTLGARLDGTAVAVDAAQRTTVPGLWAAGETTGIGGAALALAEGRLAGASAAASLQAESPVPPPPAPFRARRRLRRAARALEAAYGDPPGWAERVTDETVVCRCEEVTAAAVREAARELGAGDLRTVKLLTRAGMGWCQGRICGPGVAGVAGCPAAPSPSPFARPVPLGVLARSCDPPHEARSCDPPPEKEGAP